MICLFYAFIGQMLNAFVEALNALSDFDRIPNYVLHWYFDNAAQLGSLGMMHEDDTRKSNYVTKIAVVI